LRRSFCGSGKLRPWDVDVLPNEHYPRTALGEERESWARESRDGGDSWNLIRFVDGSRKMAMMRSGGVARAERGFEIVGRVEADGVSWRRP
jgi:hypothetical protein